MRFVRVGHFGPTFVFPVKTVNFFGVKRVAPSSTLKMRKSKKNQHVYTHTHMRIRNYVTVGADLPPPPSIIGLNISVEILMNTSTASRRPSLQDGVGKSPEMLSL